MNGKHLKRVLKIMKSEKEIRFGARRQRPRGQKYPLVEYLNWGV